MEDAKKEKIIRPKLTPIYDMLEKAIKIWWKNLSKFIKVYLWGVLFALVPVIIMLALSFLFVKFYQTSNLLLAIPFAVLFVFLALVAIYFAIRSYIGMFLLVKKNYIGNELEIFKETKKYFWSYLWLSVLTTIFILLWTLLLIIPGLIFSIFYSFAVYAFFFEDLKGMAAIKRSISLVKNYWWAVFGRFIVIAFLLWIFTMIISIPLHFTDDKSIFFSAWNSVVQIINFLIGPISLLYFYQIYQDLVKIKK
ncbi:MAG: hypothetical protein ACYC40_01175 [Patescibacteria group bacterium]